MQTVVTADGFEVSSNTESVEQMQEALGIESEGKTDGSKADAGPAAAVRREEPGVQSPDGSDSGDGAKERNSDGTFKQKGRRNDPQAAVQAAIAKQREAERRLETAVKDAEERFNARLAALELERRAQQPRVEATQQAPETRQDAFHRFMSHPEAPKRELFKDAADWSVAASGFVYQQLDEERNRREQAMLQHQIELQRQADFAKRATDKDPKFFETLRARIAAEGDPPLNRPTQDYIKASPIAPDLLVYLLDNKQDAQRLSALPPRESIEAIAEIAGLLKARQAAASTSQAPRPTLVTSNAPAPIKPVVGASTVNDDGASDDELPIEEFIRRGNKKDRSSRR